MNITREFVEAAGEQCTIAGDVCRGLAFAERPLIEVTTEEDRPSRRWDLRGPVECSGLALADPGSMAAIVGAFTSGELVEFVGTVLGHGGQRRTRALVLVKSLHQDGWISFDAVGEVP
jgi:hypothetical protein